MDHLKFLWSLENAFDQHDLTTLQKSDNNNDVNNNFHSKCISFILLVENNKFQEAINLGKVLFNETSSPIEKGFIHQWVIGCMESLFQESEREQWLKKWNQINFSFHPWLKFLKKYQLAVGYYFDSHLRESLSLFEQLVEESTQLDYPRGLEKCYFHIALIYKCLNHFEKSSELLSLSNSIAETRGSQRTLNKISDLKKTLNSALWNSASELHSIESLLIDKKNKAARKLLLHSLKIRRNEKRNWSSYSEHMYLALVSLSFGHLKRFEMILLHINDNVIKEKTLSLAKQFNLNLPKQLIEDLSYLRQILGINATKTGNTSEFMGHKFTKIKDPEVVSVVQSLCTKIEGMSKEELCIKLWNYNYDPVIHNRRIYKLIYKVKEVFRCNDVIVAKSGLYRINPKYLTT